MRVSKKQEQLQQTRQHMLIAYSETLFLPNHGHSCGGDYPHCHQVCQLQLMVLPKSNLRHSLKPPSSSKMSYHKALTPPLTACQNHVTFIITLLVLKKNLVKVL
jgi:hypothetical protein